jgi:GTPase SAR1 family protein
MREPEPYDHLFKLLLIGDAGVGKSRYVEGEEAERGAWAGAC